jgi:DNA-binding transcriptional LysR family regulator
MDLRHLRTFVTVAEQGTVSKASLRLRVAQPALSRQISELEAELGVRLFDRIRRRLVLTGEGEQLLEDCRTVLGAVGSLTEHAQLLRRGDHGILRVAATPQTIDGIFSTFLHRFAERRPNVQIKLTEAIGADLESVLERGQVHVTVSLVQPNQADSPFIDSFELSPLEFLAASATSLEIGTAGDVDIGRLAAYPLLLLDPSFYVRQTFDAACRLAGLKPNIFIESRTPMRCWHWPRPDTVWRSCRPFSRFIGTGCGSRALRTGASRCGNGSPSCGTIGACFLLTPKTSANHLPPTCARAFRSRGRRRPSLAGVGREGERQAADPCGTRRGRCISRP